MIDPRLIVLLNDLIGIANEQSILSTKERWNRERGGWKNRRKREKGGGNVPVEQGVAAKFIELSSLCTRSRARFPRFYAFHRLFFCVLFLFASSQPPRYRERNVRRRRERPATRYFASSLWFFEKKEFNGVDVWILRFCVREGYENGVWKYWYSYRRGRRFFLLCFG